MIGGGGHDSLHTNSLISHDADVDDYDDSDGILQWHFDYFDEVVAVCPSS